MKVLRMKKMFLKLRIIPRRNCIITRHIFETQVLMFGNFRGVGSESFDLSFKDFV